MMSWIQIECILSSIISQLISVDFLRANTIEEIRNEYNHDNDFLSLVKDIAA